MGYGIQLNATDTNERNYDRYLEKTRLIENSKSKNRRNIGTMGF